MWISASFAISILAAEVLLWVVPSAPRPHYVPVGVDQHETPNFVPDPILGWRLRANHVIRWDTSEYVSSASSNEEGFRDPRTFSPKDRPIIVLGDSFSFGSGVNDDETYSARLEQALQGPPVYNLGIPGFGVDQVWLTLRHEALPLKPRLVIVGIVEVDFERSLVTYDPGKTGARPSFVLHDGMLVPREPVDSTGRLVGYLKGSSHVWALIQAAGRAAAYHFPVGEWWTLNAALLAAIQTDCERAGVPVVFVRIPTKEWKAFPTLRKFLLSQDAEYIDLAEGLDQASAQVLFFPIDSHPNAAGHAYIAERVSAWVKTHQETTK